jgi:enoyl-CoA hydratase/carnithine racemase
MSEGAVHLRIEGRVAAIVFDRPDARNAMTWAMYNQLAAACERLAEATNVDAAVFRGAGESFVAGTDITQFAAFTGADDGIAYERRIDAAIAAIEQLPMPTLAVVRGPAMGGGLMIATACDLRIATPDARFGVPIARTVGNCLSMANIARLVAAFGPAIVKRLLLLAETLTAAEAAAAGFVEVLGDGEIDGRAREICRRLGESAPLTMRATREAMRRISTDDLPSGDDLIRSVYGSADFKAGVAAFIAKRRPVWNGR